ncbi:hypothetical protein [Ectopseudomonas mendocina]|uniref:hypothetical protein n=1 Tax=Ectopseudomonas mendocina TaxID=300 RepID=UPI00131A5614|nr:hypothetical protein [Pseudomonas mendocina]
MYKNMKPSAIFFAILIAGCAVGMNKQANFTDEAAENSCQQHCNLNYGACMNTANSPEARQECIDTRNICFEGC